MPPRCCAMIQLYIGLPLLDDEDARAFRSRFAEWISTYRMYCPKERCSAFIPDNHILSMETTHSQARVYDERGRIIKRTVLPPMPGVIECPTCWDKICGFCRQPSHSGQPCDYTQARETEKLLEKLNYKTCPNCRTGVKRMFGCPHMQCHCGAHWCWFCKSPIEECNGAHEEEEEDEEDDEEFADRDEGEVDEDEGEEGDDSEVGDQPSQVETALDADNDTIMTEAEPVDRSTSHATPGHIGEEVTAQPRLEEPAPASSARHREEVVENLDARGLRDWSDGQWDFGDEPEEPRSSFWGCHHRWKQVTATEGFKHICLLYTSPSPRDGLLSRMPSSA